MKTVSENDIDRVASDECQQDWNDPRFRNIYREAFKDGAKWMQGELIRLNINPFAYRYSTSQDYQELWNLISSGAKIIAYILPPDSNTKLLVEVKKDPSVIYKDSYRIGFPGVGYEGSPTKEGFFETCKAINLEYIPFFTT